MLLKKRLTLRQKILLKKSRDKKKRHQAALFFILITWFAQRLFDPVLNQFFIRYFLANKPKIPPRM